MSPAAGPPNNKNLIVEGLWRNNPIFKQVLGICSTLAVTNLVLNTVVMCVALVITLSLSSLTISWLRAWTPRKIRMMVETLIIAAWVLTRTSSWPSSAPLRSRSNRKSLSCTFAQ